MSTHFKFHDKIISLNIFLELSEEFCRDSKMSLNRPR